MHRRRSIATLTYIAYSVLRVPTVLDKGCMVGHSDIRFAFRPFARADVATPRRHFAPSTATRASREHARERTNGALRPERGYG